MSQACLPSSKALFKSPKCWQKRETLLKEKFARLEETISKLKAQGAGLGGGAGVNAAMIDQLMPSTNAG